MTVFAAPTSTLPEGGVVRRPNLADAPHQSILAKLALHDDEATRRDRTEAYATRAHEARNAPLRATAEQILATLGIADETTYIAIGRQRDGIAVEDDIKAVTSADRLVRRDWTSFIMAVFISVLMVALYVLTEIKLLGEVVMTSGVLGLLPDSLPDQFLAYAFAGAPVFWATWKFSWHERLKTSAEREAHLRTLRWWGKYVGIPAWIVAFVFLFGPNLMPMAGAVADPFADRPVAAGWISGVVTETRKILQDFAGLIPLLLFVGVLVGVSNLVAATWICQREVAARTRHEDVRDAETYAFRARTRDALLKDKIQSDGSIGRLRGLIDQIDADRDAFVEEVHHEVEAIRAGGETARRNAILERTAGDGRVIEAGPLFSRN